MPQTNIAQRKYSEIRKRAFENFINIRLFHFFIQSPSISEPNVDELIKLPVQKELYDLYARCHQMVSTAVVPGYAHITMGVLDKLYKNWYDRNIHQISVLEKEFLESHFFSKEEFLKFYGADETDRNCTYCKIFESEIKNLAESGWIKTKRHLTRGKFMELDRKDPFAPYTKDNVALCCYWCNNAKTDEFSIDEFAGIGNAMTRIWTDRLRKIDKEKK
ncbi:hypothetical protein ACDQ55_06450 [Chitinophaga sp. 30R24]|uniref:hypothetical protein n=1 Tax=Chitinophaga sp. 30R24 TaxID=3248838 RepID=UPI003B9093C7